MPLSTSNVDMLFIDTRHNSARARQELSAWSPHDSRYIVFHDTEANGMHGDNGSEGLHFAIRELVEQGEWFVAGHYPNRYGLKTVKQPKVVAATISFAIGRVMGRKSSSESRRPQRRACLDIARQEPTANTRLYSKQ